MEFILTSTEAHLLLQFELNPSLELLSKTIGRDPTAISRQLKRISEKGDFLTKVSGRWKITDTGRKFNQITKDYLLSQGKIFNQEVHLKIGSTREFCSRVLAPNISELKKDLGVHSISLISFEGSAEKSLLENQIDLAFDCGRPYSPDIGFKQMLIEPIAPIVSNKLYRKYKGLKSFKELEDYPHILCDRLEPEKISKKPFSINNLAHYSNDIATARSLCLASEGWALLPLYTIKEEIKNKKLHCLIDHNFTLEKFGVWYYKERKGIAPFFQKAIKWLKKSEGVMKLP